MTVSIKSEFISLTVRDDSAYNSKKKYTAFSSVYSQT